MIPIRGPAHWVVQITSKTVFTVQGVNVGKIMFEVEKLKAKTILTDQRMNGTFEHCHFLTSAS